MGNSYPIKNIYCETDFREQPGCFKINYLEEPYEDCRKTDESNSL